MLFGSKRERFEKTNLDAAQLELFDDYATEEQKQDDRSVKEVKVPAHERKVHKGRNKLPESLPVVEHVIEPDEDTCDMKKIGEERTGIL